MTDMGTYDILPDMLKALEALILLSPCLPSCRPQGFHPTKWRDFTTTVDGPEVAIFKEACKWVVQALGGWAAAAPPGLG